MYTDQITMTIIIVVIFYSCINIIIIHMYTVYIHTRHSHHNKVDLAQIHAADHTVICHNVAKV